MSCYDPLSTFVFSLWLYRGNEIMLVRVVEHSFCLSFSFISLIDVIDLMPKHHTCICIILHRFVDRSCIKTLLFVAFIHHPLVDRSWRIYAINTGLLVSYFTVHVVYFKITLCHSYNSLCCSFALVHAVADSYVSIKAWWCDRKRRFGSWKRCRKQDMKTWNSNLMHNAFTSSLSTNLCQRNLMKCVGQTFLNVQAKKLPLLLHRSNMPFWEISRSQQRMTISHTSIHNYQSTVAYVGFQIASRFCLFNATRSINQLVTIINPSISKPA